MLTRYRKFALVLPLVLGLGACEKDFDALNTNPNNPLSGDPAFILTNAQRANVYRLFDIPANQDGGLLVVQHWAKSQYTTEDRYGFRPGSYQSIWDGFYAGGLEDFNEVIRQGEASKNPNMQAVGLVMRSYFFSVLTDLYGDIPYTEALRMKDNIITPKYDSQEQVYTGLLADLKRASSLINATGPEVGGDIIYGGDMDKWKRFANSLRLRLAMRIADVKEAQARTEVAELLNGTTPLISSNAENAQFVFLGGAPNANPVFENRLTRDDHRVSRSITSHLTRTNDPRLPIYADPAECAAPTTQGPDSTGLYRGMPNGLTNGGAAGFGPLCSSSKVGAAFTKADAPGVLMTYSEVLFFRAEAIARGFITGDATATYLDAVRASLEQHGVSNMAATTYLARPDVNVTITPGTTGNFRQVIGTQKWIALYGQGVEAWSEFRRLDYPRLRLARVPAAAAAGKFPVRFRYPDLEQTVNTANRAAAVARQGTDLISTRLWWDVAQPQ